MRTPREVPVPLLAASATPGQAARALSDVIAAVRAARGGDVEGLAAVLSRTDPRGSFGMAIAMISGIFEFSKVSDETAEGTLAKVASDCLQAIGSASAPAQEAPPAGMPWPQVAPDKAMDNVRDGIALVRCYLACDNEGAWAILAHTSDPRGCMTVLAHLVQSVFLYFGIGKEAAGALLDDLTRALADAVLDLSADPPNAHKAPEGEVV